MKLYGAIAAAVVSTSTVAWADGTLTDKPVVQHVTGGQDAVECQWPTTVAVTGGGSLCSASLVHPRVVVYAAHCGDSNKRIRFGESSTTSAYTRTPLSCLANPDYLGTSDQAHDWAFCVLDEPITEIPVTPPLYGCETDMLQEGVQVVIAGFGDGGVDGSSGTKRWAWTQVNSVFGNTTAIGGQGNPSTCSGDSGSSAFFPMPDGSFRAISMTSTGVGGCDTTGGIHALMHPAVPWIEQNAGIDITPCFDLDGTWNPTGACDGFFAGGETPSGTWRNWCEGTPASGPSATCGDPYDSIADPGPPDVAVAAPMHGEEVPSGTPVDINVDADDGEGWGVTRVWVSIDGMVQDVEDTYPPYVFPAVPFPDGLYTIVGFAEDYAGNVGESAPVVVGVGQPVPPDATTSDTGTGDGTSDGSATGDVTSGGADGGDGGGDGCSCRTQGPAGAGFVLVTLMLVRRRTG